MRRLEGLQNKYDFNGLVKRSLLIALGVLVAAHTSAGIRYDSAASLFAVVIMLSVLNLVLKPLLILFTLPFVVLSLGLGLWFINALLFLLAGKLVSGFEVTSFPSALWGALVVSLTSVLANLLLSGKVSVKRSVSHDRWPDKRDDGDIIDI